MAKSLEIGLSYLDQLLAGAMMAQARRNSMLQQLFHKTYNQISEDLKFTKRQPAMERKKANERFLTRATYVTQWQPLQWLKR